MARPFAVTSFVIRFIHANPDVDQRIYRGVVRHVQSNQEASFTSWDQA